MERLKDFYYGKRILVTGHTGFKGSWLTLILSRLGAEVTGVSLSPKNSLDAFNAMKISSLCNDQRSDITEFDELLNVFRKTKPEIVFHLAAQSLVIESYLDPLLTFKTNIIGTANVLEASRYTDSVKAVVIVTSDKCYENNETDHAFTEEDRLGGHDPYSSSKAACEIVTTSFIKSYFSLNSSAGIATARAGNVIGGGDWAENRIIPDSIRALMKNDPVVIRNPESLRPWQHVIEPLRGYLELGRILSIDSSFKGAWNFGPDKLSNKNVRMLVNEVLKTWGKGLVVEEKSAGNNLHEAVNLSLNITKARERLGWNPVLKFEDSVKMTILWYKAQSENNDMLSFSINQIDSYFNNFKERYNKTK